MLPEMMHSRVFIADSLHQAEMSPGDVCNVSAIIPLLSRRALAPPTACLMGPRGTDASARQRLTRYFSVPGECAHDRRIYCRRRLPQYIGQQQDTAPRLTEIVGVPDLSAPLSARPALARSLRQCEMRLRLPTTSAPSLCPRDDANA